MEGGGGGIVPSVRTFSIPSSVSVFVCGKYTQLDSLSLSSLCIIFFKTTTTTNQWKITVYAELSQPPAQSFGQSN